MVRVDLVSRQDVEGAVVGSAYKDAPPGVVPGRERETVNAEK